MPWAVCGSERTMFRMSVVSFPHVGLGICTQVINLDSGHLYLVSYLIGPGLSIFEERKRRISKYKLLSPHTPSLLPTTHNGHFVRISRL